MVAVAASRAAAAPPVHVVFSPPVNLSNTTTLSDTPQIAYDAAGTAYVAWPERGGVGILLTRSTDGGATFTAPRVIVPDGLYSTSFQLDLAASGDGMLHAVTTQFDSFTGLGDVVYTGTTDGGRTFSAPTALSTVDNLTSILPRVAAGWAAAVVWMDLSLDDGRSTVWYRQSADGGQTFSPPRTFSEPGTSDGCPAVALAGDSTVYVAWERIASGIAFARSVDSGLTFSDPTILFGSRIGCPLMAVDPSGTLHVVWEEALASGEVQLFHSRSTDGGDSFRAPQAVSGSLTSPSIQGLWPMDIAVAADGTLAVIWKENPSVGTWECLISLSMDGGATFSPPDPAPGCWAVAPRSSLEVQVALTLTPPGASYSDVALSQGQIRPASESRGFFPITPCRTVDTRREDGPSGGPAPLGARVTRVFAVAGLCAVPPTALAVAANLTAVLPAVAGHLTVYPGNADSVPLVSSINFSRGQTRANNAILRLATDLTGSVKVYNGSGGTLDFVLDVAGYFQ